MYRVKQCDQHQHSKVHVENRFSDVSNIRQRLFWHSHTFYKLYNNLITSCSILIGSFIQKPLSPNWRYRTSITTHFTTNQRTTTHCSCTSAQLHTWKSMGNLRGVLVVCVLKKGAVRVAGAGVTPECVHRLAALGLRHVLKRGALCCAIVHCTPQHTKFNCQLGATRKGKLRHKGTNDLCTRPRNCAHCRHGEDTRVTTEHLPPDSGRCT